MCVAPGAIKSGIGSANVKAAVLRLSAVLDVEISAIMLTTFPRPPSDSAYASVEDYVRSRGSWSQSELKSLYSRYMYKKITDGL